MLDATLFARQWAGLVAQTRLFGSHAPGATVIEADGMVAAVMPSAPTSSVMNAALAVDPTAAPSNLAQLAEQYEAAGMAKWGLWVDGEHEEAAHKARERGMVLDSVPTPMVADLHALPFGDAAPRVPADFATVGHVNDLAYGYPEPKLAPAVAALSGLPAITYGAHHDGGVAAVAIAYDVGDDTAVWLVATVPSAQRRGLARRLLQRLLLDARERGQRTASLQSSPKGRPLYERIGFAPVGSLHLYEQRFAAQA